MSYVKFFLTISCFFCVDLFCGQEIKDRAYWTSYAQHCDEIVESLAAQITAQDIKTSDGLDRFMYKQKVNCAAAQFRLTLENTQKPTCRDICQVFVYNPVATALYLWWTKKKSLPKSLKLSFLEYRMNKVVYDFLVAKDDKEKDAIVEKRAEFIYEFTQLAKNIKNRP